MRELYFYWRARAGLGGDAEHAALRLQQQWRKHQPELICRLLRRAEGEHATWMEIYALPGGVDAALQQRLRMEGDAALAPWLDGARHLELFDPVEPAPPG